MIQTFDQCRMILTDKRYLRQCSEHNQQVRTKEDKGHTDLENSKRALILHDPWSHHVEEVEPMTDNDNRTNHLQHRDLAFRIPCHEQQERQNKVHYQVRVEYPAVRTRPHSFDEVYGLFRDVRIPNQQKLAEPDVSPENRKRKAIFPEVV